MVWKTIPTISQSSIKLLTKRALPYKLVPSNSVYFRRYPYKVVFEIPVDPNVSWSKQLKTFKLDLTGFTEDMLNFPTRQYMASQQPSLFIQDYDDLTLTLAVYNNYVAEVRGPTSKDHLDLLFSSNFKCEGKNKLWYNMYDCKIEIWLPFKFRSYNYVKPDPADTNDGHELVSYIQDNIDIHVPRSWASRYSTTIYCKFDEFLAIYPFVKMSYPNHRIDITKAVVKS